MALKSSSDFLEKRRDYEDILHAHLQQRWQRTECGQMFRMVQHHVEMGWYDKNSIMNSIDLRNRKYAVGWLAGPIALLRDYSEAVDVTNKSDIPAIKVYSPAGYLMKTIKWNRQETVGMGWTASENLVVVRPNGTVEEIPLSGPSRSYQIASGTAEDPIIGVKFYHEGYGMAAITRSGRFYGLANFDTERPKGRLLGSIKECEEPVICYDILSCDREVQVIAAAGSGLYILKAGECREILGPEQQRLIQRIKVSPSGNKVAFWTPTATCGELHIISNNFQRVECIFKSQEPLTPKELHWVGDSAVALYYTSKQTGKSEVIRVIPALRKLSHQDADKLPATAYFTRVLLQSERDGLRVITEEKHEFWEEVPPPTVETFMQASDSNKLLNARVAFECRDPSADALIRDIKSSMTPDALPRAIETCMFVASREWDPKLSRYLLKAARFGMDFFNMPRDHFVHICKSLRILNELRNSRVALPLTMTQYVRLTANADPQEGGRAAAATDTSQGMQHLIDRLISRNIYWLAHEVCRFIGSENSQATNRVLVHWAKMMIERGRGSDESIAENIISKLKGAHGISFAAIAEAALDRPTLALRLIREEPRASRQVPLLLRLNKPHDALQCALDSGDSNLAYFVLDRLKAVMSDRGRQSFWLFMEQHQAARKLFLQYCRETDERELESHLKTVDAHHELGIAKLRRAYEGDYTTFRAELKAARDEFQQDTGGDQFFMHACDEQLHLMKVHADLRKKYQLSLEKLSLSETLYQLLLKGRVDIADSIKKTFHVSDKRYCWIKLQGLVQAGNWSELDKWGKSKQPIPWESFVEACLVQKEGTIDPRGRQCAVTFAHKISSKPTRAQYLCKSGAFKDAAELALQLRDVQLLERIRKDAYQARDMKTVTLIDQAMS